MGIKIKITTIIIYSQKNVLINYLKLMIKNKFCINDKCYIMIESTFLKKLILIKQANQKNMIFVAIGIF